MMLHNHLSQKYIIPFIIIPVHLNWAGLLGNNGTFEIKLLLRILDVNPGVFCTPGGVVVGLSGLRIVGLVLSRDFICCNGGLWSKLKGNK